MNEAEKYSLLLHTDVLATFNEAYFKKVLDVEHITSDGIVNFPKVKDRVGDDKEINFFGWVVTKDNVSWLIPNTLKDGTIVKVKDIFPLVPSKFEEVGFQNKAYRYVYEYNVVKYKSENKLGMKKLVDILGSTPHSNPKHRKLLIMAVLSQVFSRSYYRFSSPPGFGKDSIVDTLGLLIGGCATIENPSVPKLERESSIRTLSGLNEVVGITKSQWQDIGKFILAACAYKPSITKRTRAFGGVGETINLRGYSMSLFYNDIECYTDKNIIYFDNLAEEGIRDRLPAMRLYGNFIYDFNLINTINIEEFVKEHWNDILDIIYTLTYYKEHLFETKGYKYDLKGFPQRWQRSLGVLLQVTSAYCKDQKEFDEWVKLLKDSMQDYVSMIEYVKLKDSIFKGLSDKQKVLLSEKLIKDTYSEKIKVLNDHLTGGSKSENKEVKGFW